MEDDIQQQLAAQQYGAAFELLLERFKDKVFRLAFSMMRNETQAEDVAQDVFVKIWKALPGYHGSASLSTWIYTITRNTCLTELKKRATRPTVSLHEPEMEAAADTIPALQTAAPEAGGEMDVEVLLAELPDKYRQVITLFYLEQKAYDEVAAMLGIPLGTVKTLLFRAKKELLKIGTRQTRMDLGEGILTSVSPTRSRRGARVCDPQHVAAPVATGICHSHTADHALRVTDPRSASKAAALTDGGMLAAAEFNLT